jgi:hypothetical protein
LYFIIIFYNVNLFNATVKLLWKRKKFVLPSAKQSMYTLVFEQGSPTHFPWTACGPLDMSGLFHIKMLSLWAPIVARSYSRTFFKLWPPHESEFETPGLGSASLIEYFYKTEWLMKAIYILDRSSRWSFLRQKTII